MRRNADQKLLNVAASASQTTEDVDIRKYTMFSVDVGTVTAGTTHLQALSVPTDSGAGQDAYDHNNSLMIVAITANSTVALPPDVATLHRIKLEFCSAADGTAKVQTAATTLTLRMKA